MCLDFSSDVFQCFQNHISAYPLFTLVATCPAHHIILDLIALLMLVTIRKMSHHYAVFPSFLLLRIMLKQLVTLKSGILLE